MHNNHLGSVAFETDESGAVSQASLYQPYGASLKDSNKASEKVSTYSFSGKEEDGSGLYYFEARYYDPVTTRFVSPDPLFAVDMEKCIESIIECNLYQYTGNNPVVRTDPTGQFLLLGAAVGGGIGFIASVGTQMLSGDGTVNWKVVAASTVSGAVVGFTGGAAAGVAGTVGLTAGETVATVVTSVGSTAYVGGAVTKVIENVEGGKPMVGVHKAGAISAVSNIVGVGVGNMVKPIAKSMSTTVKPAVQAYPVSSIRPNNSITRFLVDTPKEVMASEFMEQAIQDTAGETVSNLTNAAVTASSESN